MKNEERIWDCYNELLLSDDVERVRKLLVRYELYKRTSDIPGDIVECGVFKGVGLMYWLKLLAIFDPGSKKRVIGFDTFDGFADTLLPYEKVTADAYVKEANFKGTDPTGLTATAEKMGLGKRVELVKGDLTQTAKAFVEKNPGVRISLLHLDVDTLLGTRAALEAFYPIVARGGVVILDEYGCKGWGESDAVDEYFKNLDVRIQSVPYSSKPTAFVIKP
jgi:hypothetical protein